MFGQVVVGLLQHAHQSVQYARVPRSKPVNRLLREVISQNVFRINQIHLRTSNCVGHAIAPYPLAILAQPIEEMFAWRACYRSLIVESVRNWCDQHCVVDCFTRWHIGQAPKEERHIGLSFLQQAE